MEGIGPRPGSRQLLCRAGAHGLDYDIHSTSSVALPNLSDNRILLTHVSLDARAPSLGIRFEAPFHEENVLNS